MCNEELAQAIKQGQPELKPLLWEQVQKLLELKAQDCYCKYFSRCIKCGIDLTDIYQECYFVFEEALKAYNHESGYKFTTYLTYPLKNAFLRLLGYNNDNNTALNDDFIKKSSIISYSYEALKEVHEDIERFAKAEGLTAHANSVAVRFEG